MVAQIRRQFCAARVKHAVKEREITARHQQQPLIFSIKQWDQLA
jgi:hypothetical protein